MRLNKRWGLKTRELEGEEKRRGNNRKGILSGTMKGKRMEGVDVRTLRVKEERIGEKKNLVG